MTSSDLDNSRSDSFSSPSDSTTAGSNIGSLSQSARSKQLNSARGILLFVGVLTVVVNGIFFAMIENQVDQQLDQEVRQLRNQGMMIDEVKLAEIRTSAIQMSQLIQGAAIGLGAVFIVLGFLVKVHPVPVTTLGLVLYVGAAIVFGLIEPMTLVQGIIIKVFIVFALIKSLQSAIAYKKEEEALQAQMFGQRPAEVMG